LLTSEEYEERKRRTDNVGHVGLNPRLVPLIVNKAKAAGLRVSAHVDTVTDYRIALKAGVDEMSHLPGYYFGLEDDPRKYELTEEDVKETARRGVWVDIVPVAIEIFNPQDPILKAQIKERIDAVKIHNLKLLKRFNVKIAFGSDWHGRTPVIDVLYLQKLSVFSNLEMLRIWCEDTPRSIFPNRKIGLLKAGYEASFIVLDGNPLVDFEQIKNIRLRFKQGYILDAPKRTIPQPDKSFERPAHVSTSRHHRQHVPGSRDLQAPASGATRSRPRCALC
jgi:imidazolonepropionase-like amidohydrolase